MQEQASGLTEQQTENKKLMEKIKQEEVRHSYGTNVQISSLSCGACGTQQVSSMGLLVSTAIRLLFAASRK